MLAEDRIAIAASSVITLAGNDIYYNGTSIGQFYGGRGGDFLLYFGQQTTAAAVEVLVEHLTYQNVAETPTASRTLQLSIEDAAGDYAPGDDGGRTHGVTINVRPEPPLLFGLDGNRTFAENTVNETPQRIDADVSVFGVRLASGTLSVTGLLAEDRVALATDDVIGVLGTSVLYNGTVIGTFSGGHGGTFSVAFIAAATAVAVEAVIEHLTYANVSDTPAATRTLRLSLVDATGTAAQTGFAATPDADSPLAGIDVGDGSKPAFVDLDGDGRLDLVVGSEDGTLRTYLRRADGTFAEAIGAANPFAGISVGTRSTPTFTDVNGDGRLDLVVGSEDGTLRTFLRESDKTFTQALGAADPFFGIDVGNWSAPTFTDMNGDGQLDLVVGAYNGTLRTYLRGSDGSFMQAVDAASPIANRLYGIATSPAFADLNGDGQLDLVVGNIFGRVNTYLRQSDGSFKSTTGAAGPTPNVVANSLGAPSFVDLNGDGQLEIVLGAGDGSLHSYTAGAPPLDVTVTVAPESDLPVLTDLNRVVTVAENVANAAPQRLDADVNFFANVRGSTLTVSGALPEDRLGIAADGSVSLAGSSVLFGGVLIGQVSGGQGTPLRLDFGEAATHAAVEAVIERLTYQNLSDAPTATRTLTLDFVDATGARLTPGFSGSPDPVHPFSGIKVGNASAPTFTDVNGDGRLDLVVGAYDGTLRTYLRGSDGIFTQAVGAADPFAGIDVGDISRPTFTDVNGDGRLDLVVGSYYSNALRTYLRGSDGSFTQIVGAADPFYGIDVGTGMAPAFADVNGDGRLDLVVGNYYGGLRTYLRGSDGTLTQATEATDPFWGLNVGYLSTPTFADVNGDGRVDLVVGAGNGALRTYLRGSDGTFTRAVGAADPISDIGWRSNSAPAFADVNGDGRLDLVVGEYDGTLRFFSGGARGSLIVTVTPQNDLPVLTGVSGALALAPGGAAGPQALFGRASLDDLDSNPAAVTVSGLLAADRVGFATGAGIKIVGSTLLYDGASVGFITGGVGETLTISFTAGATPGIATAILRALTFETDMGVSSTRSLQIILTDSAGGSITPAPLAVSYDAAPRLAGIALGAHDGTLRAGESISLTLDFSGPVTVTGTPLLTLSDGGTASYVSGSGTDSLVFRHTVAAGQNAADLAVTGLDLAGGTLADARGVGMSPVPRGGLDPAGTLAVDTLTPDAPSLTGEAATGLVRSPTPMLTGTAEAGSRVLVALDDARTATVTAGADGRFAYTVTDPLEAGSHSLRAYALDAAGNTSRVLSTGFIVVGADAPTDRPFGLTLAPADDTGISTGDGLTARASLTVSGYGVSGTRVQLFDDADGNGRLDPGERALATLTVTNGRFAGLVGLSGDGPHRIVAAGLGPDGSGTGSDPLAITLDRTAPRVTGVTVTGDGLADGAGTLTVGQSARFTLSLSEAITPPAAVHPLSLTLGHGGRAGYNAAASDARHLVFDYTVRVDDIAADLTVTGGRNDGPTLTDAAGNFFRFDGAASNPAGTLRIDGLTGTGADESFRGTPGADTFRGGGGDDTYLVDHADDRVVEASGGGRDTILARVDTVLAQGQEIEVLAAADPAGLAALHLTGNAGANILTGNAGDNRLDGGAGADTMTGSLGDDTYIVDDAGDYARGEGNDGGTDTVISSIDYMLRVHFENLTLTGSAVRGTGNAGDNLLIGNPAANILDGQAGADTMAGGAGDDVYLVDDAEDRVIDQAGPGGGNDKIRASISYDLADAPEVEALQLVGAGDDSARGNEGDNVILGNAGGNRIAGGLGNDKLTGGLGADTFVFDTGLGRGNVDKITDFTHGLDHVELSRAIFTALTGDALSAEAFKDLGAAGASVDADDRILYDARTGGLSYDADGAGGVKAVQFALLSNKPLLDHTDFLLSA